MPLEKLLIYTDRLHIRNLKESDLEPFHHYRSDPEVAKYQGYSVMDKDECRDFILERADKLFGKPGEWVQYGIENREEKLLIGDCAIKLREKEPRIAEVGISITPGRQRKGFAREALVGILKFLFEEKDVHRIVETVVTENIASIQLIEKVGFKKEGHFIENHFENGKWGSEYQYAMLKREWLTLKDKL